MKIKWMAIITPLILTSMALTDLTLPYRPGRAAADLIYADALGAGWQNWS